MAMKKNVMIIVFMGITIVSGCVVLVYRAVASPEHHTSQNSAIGGEQASGREGIAIPGEISGNLGVSSKNSDISINQVFPILNHGAPSISAEEAFEKKKLELFSYSRAGNFQDTKPRLKQAHDEGILNADEYYGELGHMLSITVDKPVSIVKEILESGNEYGRDVMLANLCSNITLPNTISISEKKEIFELINESRQKIGGGIHQLGFTDVFRYENWINTLKAYAPNESYFYRNLEDLIQRRMLDPREMIALQSTFKDDKFLVNIDDASRERYLYYIDRYIESYPENSVASSINRSKRDYVELRD